jgi:hypothetical protein
MDVLLPLRDPRHLQPLRGGLDVSPTSPTRVRKSDIHWVLAFESSLHLSLDYSGW